MASKTPSFSPAAKLYAKNFAIVDAVKTEFANDVKTFLDALETELRELRGERFQQRATGGYRYWWLGDANIDGNTYPQLWLETLRPELIIPGELRLNVYWPESSEEQKSLLKSIIEGSSISDRCKRGASGKWSPFTVDIAVYENVAIENLATEVAEILDVISSAATATP